MILKHIAALAVLPLLLTACGSPDTESMRAGLQKSGLTAAQADCRSDALAGALDADAFNQIADYLNQGESFDEAAQRTRRKFGAEFREQLTAVKGALAACGG
ncbi:hypothetical protein [Thiocystis violascens]|uniref:Lipoprotein n=1 Tax=Thiocystis violascens (strain ATCC 17096 / DSM 198 / 6111) TaxID=765911 RepID=I3Y5J7_THIV6|nr:hypothetical protein [Thiocystis violascens]AFL72265.1 hypothetical protein Thivi_0193 [Thiocystis violascens DSM 198]